MTSMGPRILFVLAPFAFGACVLDLEGLSGEPRTSAGDGGRTDTGTTADACPGTHGPPAVRVTSGAISFCIDATEVTNGQFAEFLATNPVIASQAGPCTDNVSFVPERDWPGAAALPVSSVDWCDARAYCAWAGKRLCGKISGASLVMSERNDEKQSQWFFACSGGGAKTFPYGASFDPSACITNGTRTDVASKKTCEGGFSGVFDMSGSVEEWVDECTGDFADCLARGGNYSDSKGFECASELSRAQLRGLGEAWRGFRCCSQ